MDPVEVYVTSWWMAHYDAKTCKRHIAYSNSPTVRKLNLGTLSKEQKERVDLLGVRATRRYFDKKGRSRFVGTKQLRATGILSLN